MHRIALISAVILSVGCSLDTGGSGDDTILGGDTGDDTLFATEDTEIDSAIAIDSESVDSAEDSSVIDSTIDTDVPDTTVADTGPFDTGPFDTGVADTGPFDTGPFDTGVPDTGPEVPPPTGSITGKFEAGGGTINLSDGALGWGHWGLNAAGDYNHKSGSDLISKGTNSGAARYDNYPITFTWSDGTPTATGNTKAGIYLEKKDDSFSFDASADPATRTLKVYVSWSSGNGKLEATLSDSPAAYAGTYGAISAGPQTGVFTLVFKSATAGAKINLKLSKTNFGPGNYISLLAATLK